MLDTLKQHLEKIFYANFIVRGNNRNFSVYLDEKKEKFFLSVNLKNGIRLQISLKPEQYGGQYLHSANSASEYKKRCFVSLWENSKFYENINVFINGTKQDADAFINNTQTWEMFEISFSYIPFENDVDLLCSACELLISMGLSLVDYYIEGFAEGKKTTVVNEKYERNPINRKICLSAKGYVCQVCGFDFEKTYGPIGKETIDVHHIIPVSLLGDDYIIRPLDDLIPICPNCHRIAHKKNPPYTPEEIKDMLNKYHS